MHYTCRSFIGSPNQHSWSQYWENEPDDPQIVSQRGHLFALINLFSTDSDKEINIVGHDLISEISESYFSSTDDPIDLHLKTILESISSNPLYHNYEINLVVAVIHQSRLYLAALNFTQAIINRNNKLSILLSGKESEVIFVSGPIQPQDKIILTTTAFLEKFSLENLKIAISQPSIQDIEESILSSLYSIEVQDKLAAVLIQPHTEDESVIEEASLLEPETPGTFQEATTSIPPASVSPSTGKSVFISNHDLAQVTRRKKLNFLIALILLLALSLSAFFGYKKNQADKTEKQFQEFKSQIDQKLSQAVNVKNLNLDTAQELARQSQEIYDRIITLNIHQNELESYRSRIHELLSQTGSSDSFEPQFLYDTSLISENEKPNYTQILYRGNTLYLLDTTVGSLDSLNPKQKNIQKISENTLLKDAAYFTVIDDKVYALSSSNVYLVAEDDLESKVDISENNISPAGLESWNGALYILDSAAPTIWKLTPNASGFGSPKVWLKDGQKISGIPSSMAINGKIWLISQSGEIQPFDRGIKADYSQPESAFTRASNLVTTLETDILAFTDNDNLVYIFNKNGQSQAKYNLGEKKIIDIAINEADSTLYLLLDDQKIYQISF
ncbi:MAG: hypothetical protein ACOX6N_01640 [Patescibacteria group bacterium]|jgi:hypothetical protein